MSRYNPERRIPWNLDHLFAFRTRDGYADSAPTLSVYWTGGTQTYAMTAVRAPDVITDVTNGGRDLEIECTAQPGSTLRGIIMQLGGYVWIDGGALYQGPGRVMRLVSQTAPVAGVVTAVVRLAEPLPDDVQPVASYTGAAGSITVVDASSAVDGTAFSLYGDNFEYLDNNGDGNVGLAIDIGGGGLTDEVLADRIAEAINARGNGLVAEVDGDTITITGLGDGAFTLPDPLDPNGGVITAVDLTGATNAGEWRLRWAIYTATLLAAHVGSARVRNVRWEIPWTRRTGGDAPAVQRRDEGFLHVSRVPFDTGLEDPDLYAHVPGWARTVPDREGSWAEQRWLAEDELIARLRPRLLAGLREDDCLAEQFRRPHALLTAALILRGQAALGYDTAEQAEALHAQALEALDLAFACLTYLDANGDRVVDAGETGRNLASGNVFSSTAFTEDDCDDRPARKHWWDKG